MQRFCETEALQCKNTIKIRISVKNAATSCERRLQDAE